MSAGLQFLSLISVLIVLLPGFCLGQADSASSQPFALVSGVAPPDSVSSFPAHEVVPQWYDMFANIPHDWVRWGEVSFTAQNIPLIIGITASTVALVAVDEPIWQASDKAYKTSKFVEKSSDIFEMFGDGKTQFGLAAAFGIYGLAAKDARALRTASQTVEVILACGTVVQVLKHMTGRESPFVATVPAGRWQLLPNQIEYHKHVPNYDAFPSGHVATGLATVTVIAENYSEVGWIRPVGYTLVGLLAIAMGNTGIHWYSDYPLGIALGYSFGMLVAHPEEMSIGETKNQTPVKLSFAPMINQTGGGIRVAMSF
jgi:hypothetical protein